ncbi:hypothetical protein PTTG_28360 [Puccinia triticina 1-1 BBBD Race 1]|uniref:ATPase domain-containing protein n=1 Tax=Puccinia triticina (isolate 1-1 / race 1 (BBBD)) TaxID=630390 RepID=A0A180GCA7_PUCT1|nr:hypothetical protein PTTG_28360 [Puccinia triticina 1-1 BBBD Race 1]
MDQLTVSLGPLSVKFGKKKPSATSAATVFKALGDSLKPWNFYHGTRPPVLVIDEANFFRHMNDPGKFAFLNFAVQASKQDEKMHVILTSSDSFFESWLRQYINPAHFETITLGDLPIQEAHTYFLEMVEKHRYLQEEDKSILRSINFDIPFKMTGGRMHFIDKYISQVSRYGYFDEPARFEPVRNAYNAMEGNFTGHPKTYGAQEALKVSKLLIQSPGYISYSKTIALFNVNIVEEMIERNLLHYRPASGFSRDLIPLPSKSVLTAPSEPALRAMEELVAEYENHSTSNGQEKV